MQAFQPSPINLPGSDQSHLYHPGGGDFHIPKNIGKKFKWGIIVFLGIVSLFIIVVAGNYSTTQRQIVQNQDIRPLGYVHTESVQVTTPTASEIIDLPLFIQGTAVVDWFSDGIFPIEIRDGKNNVLASVYAIADIADPNSEVANFRAVVDSFDMKPETSIGRVVLYKQKFLKNPSSSEIASIGIDFGGLLGTKKIPEKKVSETTTTEKKSTSVWTNTSKNNTTETTQKTTTSDPYAKYQKVIGGPYTCANGIDDDKDGTIDSEDPSCHTDGYPSNDRTYDGDLDEAKRAVTEKDSSGNYPNDNSGTNTSGSDNSAPEYRSTNTIWTGNVKIRAEQ